MKQNVLQRIDSKTPEYRNKIERELSPQQRKILSTIVRHGRPVRNKDLAIITRIFQQNRTSAQINRMIKKGYIERLNNGAYFINSEDPDLITYLQLRIGGSLIN